MNAFRIGWKAASADRKVASVRFRVDAPVAALRERGRSVEIFDPAAPERYDLVVFVKSYSKADLATAEALTAQGCRVVFDLCDNHFYNPDHLARYERARADMLQMIRLADAVTCSTAALAAIVAREAPGARIAVVEDIAERAPPARHHSSTGAFGLELAWFGSHGSPNAPGGMEDILSIHEALTAAARQGPLRLTVVSNSREKFDALIAPLPFDTRYLEWSEDAQRQALAGATGAVIPITLNPFTRCKTHNRLSTALYAGTPVLATGIDSYRELAPFCTLDDWSGGLERLRSDPQGERRRAARSRAYIDRRWSPDAIALQWEAALGLPRSSPRGFLSRLWGRA